MTSDRRESIRKRIQERVSSFKAGDLIETLMTGSGLGYFEAEIVSISGDFADLRYTTSGGVVFDFKAELRDCYPIDKASEA